MRRLLSLIITFCTLHVSAQDIIQMEKTGGVYKVPCKINGLGLKFIFDTGASDVSLSLSEAVFMVKNGYLNESDFRGTETYRIANGDIAEGTKVNLRKVEFGKQTLYNVEASIVHSMDAPLLLGQSVLQRLGKFSVDYSNNTLIIGIGSVVSNKSNSNSNTNSTTSNTTGTVTDINGKVYKTVKIGDQWWMAENLDVDRFRNGDLIPEAKTNEEWIKAGQNMKPAWCYNKDSNDVAYYGKLYNWYAVVDSRGLAPEGWRVFSYEDFKLMQGFLLDSADILSFNTTGDKLKSVDHWKEYKTGGWYKCESCADWTTEYMNKVPCHVCKDSRKVFFPIVTHDGGGTNESGFNGLPGGIRTYEGIFWKKKSEGHWWSTSESEYSENYAWTLLLTFDRKYIQNDIQLGNLGLSVRCVKY